jgi:uncharacterized protein YecE (DUF72 family)
MATRRSAAAASAASTPPAVAPHPPILIGTAGWTLPREVQTRFPAEGTHLQRYAGVFPVAEINSSFHRPHRPSTYAKWADSVPEGFRFSAKLPKEATHTRKLVDAEGVVDGFLAASAGLGDKLRCVLVQLPPSLAFDADVADAFFRHLRSGFEHSIACEPRHPTWFGEEAGALLTAHRAARVAADPARVPEAAEPGGWDGLAYWRLHGSPRMYYSSYPDDYLASLADRLRASAEGGAETWCIFDNTASGAAAGNALDLSTRLGQERP